MADLIMVPIRGGVGYRALGMRGRVTMCIFTKLYVYLNIAFCLAFLQQKSSQTRMQY